LPLFEKGRPLSGRLFFEREEITTNNANKTRIIISLNFALFDLIREGAKRSKAPFVVNLLYSPVFLLNN
jgi:hypothetical protein